MNHDDYGDDHGSQENGDPETPEKTDLKKQIWKESSGTAGRRLRRQLKTELNADQLSVDCDTLGLTWRKSRSRPSMISLSPYKLL